jgi:spoIIIJ-associated protein
MQSVESEGKTVEEAVENALSLLGLQKEQVSIEVMAEGNRRLFGLIGAKGVKVRVTAKEATADGDPQKIVETLLGNMKFEATVRCRRSPEGYWLDILTAESSLIIGRGGRTLEALQYIANRIYRRSHPQGERLLLDVGKYRQNREETLTTMASRLAEKVRKNQEPVTLAPLNPHERRIIHLALQNTEGIKTFSQGEGFWRQLVIAPADV